MTTTAPRMDLGERMKLYEQEGLRLERVPNDYYIVVRSDGRGFSKYTRRFKKPFDSRMTKTMIQTMQVAVRNLHPLAGYTHSDEITLIFGPAPEGGEHLFGGRVFKLQSLLSSIISVNFNHFAKQNGLITPELPELPVFDARILVFSQEMKHEILNHMIWRSRFDCRRNCISTFARYHFGHRALHGKNVSEMSEMLKAEGVTIPAHLYNGVYCKFDETKDLRLFTMDTCFSEENLEMLLARRIENVPKSSYEMVVPTSTSTSTLESESAAGVSVFQAIMITLMLLLFSMLLTK